MEFAWAERSRREDFAVAFHPDRRLLVFVVRFRICQRRVLHHATDPIRVSKEVAIYESPHK